METEERYAYIFCEATQNKEPTISLINVSIIFISYLLIIIDNFGYIPVYSLYTIYVSLPLAKLLYYTKLKKKSILYQVCQDTVLASESLTIPLKRWKLKKDMHTCFAKLLRTKKSTHTSARITT